MVVCRKYIQEKEISRMGRYEDLTYIMVIRTLCHHHTKKIGIGTVRDFIQDSGT